MKNKDTNDILVYIDDIAESIARIEDYARGISQADFFEDAKIQSRGLRAVWK